jgi:signal peptidase I
VKSYKGEVLLDLVKAGQHHRAVIDVASGQVSLGIEGLKDFQPTAATSLRGPGKYHLMFANCDRQLLLWVDDEVVAFGDEQNLATTFVPAGADRPRTIDRRDPGDLAPAQIGSSGAAVHVKQIRLYRDIYYIADAASDAPNFTSAIRENNLLPGFNRKEFAEFLAEPGRWQGGADGNIFDGRRAVEFQMNADEFFMLGDNSPASKDSRLWEGGHVVDRKLLIGKALFIYWPHAWPTSYNFAINVFGSEVRLPFYPNFKRMQLIR